MKYLSIYSLISYKPADLEQQPWTVGRTEIVKDIAPPFYVKGPTVKYVKFNCVRVKLCIFHFQFL